MSGISISAFRDLPLLVHHVNASLKRHFSPTMAPPLDLAVTFALDASLVSPMAFSKKRLRFFIASCVLPSFRQFLTQTNIGCKAAEFSRNFNFCRVRCS